MTDMLRELAEVVREWESVEGHEAMVLEKMHMLSAAGDFIRTHHAEIAQNAEAAKRLRALEMAMDNWDADYGTTDGLCIRERADEIMRGES